MIKRSGENVAGEEVEFTFMEHPAIEECVVFAVDDPIRTEEVFAAIALRAGWDVSERELVEWCGERLSAFKVPRYVRLEREGFPRLANGKVDRLAVRGASALGSTWDRMAAERPPHRLPTSTEAGEVAPAILARLEASGPDAVARPA